MGFHSPYLLLQFVCLGHLHDLHPGIFTTKTRIHSFFLSYFEKFGSPSRVFIKNKALTCTIKQYPEGFWS